MIKNKTIQVIFETIYIVLGAIGIIGSFGYFNKSFNQDFYLFYTNLSNYICFGIIVYIYIKNVKKSLNKEDGLINELPTIRFMAVVLILVTFLVYNILLAKQNTISDYFLSINNLLFHVLLPIMFIADWIMFSNRNKIKIIDPILATILPLIYVSFILIRAAIIGPNTNKLLYPYFFLNAGEIGLGGVAIWIIILVLIFIIIGYILYLYDHHKNIDKN